MESINVFQIGLGSFGKYGFEKFIDMDQNLPEVDVSFSGLAEPDFEKRQDAKKFAELSGVEMDFYRSKEELYEAASKLDGKVLVYDAGPTPTHSQSIYESIRHGFFHIAEKPPSLTRQEHIKERKMASEKDVFWTADFIERESPVVKKAEEIIENKRVDEIKVFRESTVGIQKLLQPIERIGVQGGDVLDKMTHEIFVLDLLESSKGSYDLKLRNAYSDYLMPSSLDGESFMSIEGGKTDDPDRCATGKTSAEFSSDSCNVQLNTSWLGVSSRCRQEAKKLDFLDHSIISSSPKRAGGAAFIDEEARFFVIEGERNLIGDMLNGKLVDFETEKVIPTPDLSQDQLHRVLKKAVLRASGRDVGIVSNKKLDVFMNSIFDVRESVLQEDIDEYEELKKSRDRVENLLFDRSSFEIDDLNTGIGSKKWKP